MSAPKITVLMSVYNSKDWLQYSIESMLAQNFEDFEFLIVNDGSTDESLSVLERFARIDKRIKVLNKNNSGLTKSLNYGLKFARGAWVARLDSDDIAEPGRLEKQYEFAATFRPVVVGSSLSCIDETGDISSVTMLPAGHAELVGRLLKRKMAFPHSSAFISSEALLVAGGYRERFYCSQDSDLWLRLSELGELASIPEPLVRIRNHSHQVSNLDGGRRQKIYSRAALVSYYIRRYGMEDPLGKVSEDHLFNDFYNFLSQELNNTHFFLYRDFIEELKRKIARFEEGASKEIGVLLWKNRRFLFRMLAEKVRGEDLCRGIAERWCASKRSS